MSNLNDDWKQISVSLPVRYWIAVFAITDEFVKNKVSPKVHELQKRDVGLEKIPDEVKVALMGPVFARAAIADMLCAAGVMKPEIKEKIGTDKLTEMAKKFYDQRRKSNGSH